ncbi:P-loop containing nucleoside triphosphate hydrolase protein [Coemansia spiralis]|nr:P-loop containing nucleoside triphosphate hydrolase protein [Coemansia spiralis]
MMSKIGKLNGAEKEKDTNIQVVVRCRDATGRQARTNTAIVVPPLYGQDVKIDGPPAVARTYHFDGVFGPKATQENIYDKIVSPILNEVMQGYNCTIFAYGQTGTGKTYTMEGDLDSSGVQGVSTPQVSRIPTPASMAADSPPPLNTDPLITTRMSAQAGIIPRVLSNMFYALEKNSSEYYVRVSYLELYNEELRDLLAGADLDDPREMPTGHLKVYESGTDKGVVIQGLEERIVTNARDALALMQAGALRRRVAATRCNDSSSRSHAIFTITVFIRERAVTVEGEDIVKLGKLNLVDLAGSENIGRSGAQGLRAQEAGNINKSLLVLGRVINSLVERNTYVPYRDSKLTYILKDSLGGRTRTCMIATMSTAVSNIEETIKTLQYASQAKGIRNRPVANKKVSKSEIVHDMQLQIEQLKRDLDAARDGAGFFITKETYEELTTNAKASREIVEEWKQRVALWEEEMQKMTNKYAELTRDHSDALQTIQAKNNDIAQLEARLGATREELRGQAVLTRAHQMHESRLDGVARHLSQSLEASRDDNEGLYGKIARMAECERLNLDALARIGQTVQTGTSRAAQSLAEFGAHVREHAGTLLGELGARVGAEFDSMIAETIKRHHEKVAAELAAMVDGARHSGEESHGAAQRAAALVDGLLCELVEHSTGLSAKASASCERLIEDIHGLTRGQAVAFAQTADELRASLHKTVEDTLGVLRQSSEHAASVVEWMAGELRKSEEKSQLLAAETRQSADALFCDSRGLDDQLIAVVQKLVGERREREALAQAALGRVAEARTAEERETHGRVEEKMAALSAHADATVESTSGLLATAEAAAAERLQASHHELEKSTAVLGSVALNHKAQALGELEQLHGALGTAQAKVRQACAELVDTSSSLGTASGVALQQHAERLVADVGQMQETTTGALNKWRLARSTVEELSQKQAVEQHELSTELTRSILALAEDTQRENAAATVETGSTPQRRSYNASRWNVTRAHEYILSRLDDAGDLEWTGEPANESEPMDTETAVPSPECQENGSPVIKQRPESRVLKRPSEATVVETVQRPTQRARRSEDGEAETEAVDSEDQCESAIPLPPNAGASRLPVPSRRSTRRTRG